MAGKNIASNFARYFHEMKSQATSHDKIVLLLTIAIWIGCGYGSYHGLAASMQWSKGLVLLIAVAIGAAIWLLIFSLGVAFRPERWYNVFPPYKLIGVATAPGLFIAIITGFIVGVVLFKLPLSHSIGASFLGFLVTFFGTHILFLMYAPLTRTAVRMTHNPNIMTVDSHRLLWLFPALGILALFFISKRFVPIEFEAVRHVAVTAAIAMSVVFAGFGAGYIP